MLLVGSQLVELEAAPHGLHPCVHVSFRPSAFLPHVCLPIFLSHFLILSLPRLVILLPPVCSLLVPLLALHVPLFCSDSLLPRLTMKANTLKNGGHVRWEDRAGRYVDMP